MLGAEKGILRAVALLPAGEETGGFWRASVRLGRDRTGWARTREQVASASPSAAESYTLWLTSRRPLFSAR